jgi:hypothetical protein
MTNISALKSLYTSLGGSLTDSYDDIADGAKVGDYSQIADGISAVAKKATGGGNEPFIIPVTWDSTNSVYVTTITQAELTAAVEKDKYNIFFDIALNPSGNRILKAEHISDGDAVAATFANVSSNNTMTVETWRCAAAGPQGFGIYYEYLTIAVNNADHTASSAYTAIPNVI